MSAELGTLHDGRQAVHRMAEAGHHAELVHVQAVLECWRLTQGELCGHWVNAHLPAEAQPSFGRRNLRTLARFGVILPTGDRARGGHRAYYVLPDAAGVSRALRELGWPG